MQISDLGFQSIVDAQYEFTEKDKLKHPSCSPPEVVHGLNMVDEKIDVWQLGVILFELCALEKPFDFYKIPTPQELVIPKLPQRFAELQPVLERMLHPNPRMRATMTMLTEQQDCIDLYGEIISLQSKYKVMQVKEPATYSIDNKTTIYAETQQSTLNLTKAVQQNPSCFDAQIYCPIEVFA